MSWFEDQLETRRRLDDEQIVNAYERIAYAVKGGKHSPQITLDDIAATDRAMAVVLHYYGATAVEVPVSVTDPVERIDAAIRSCGILKRKVVFEDNWWKDAAGAYLGTLTTGEPVAIVPLGVRGYGYVEPATNKKVRLNSRTAANIMPNAYCFYRTLPEKSLTVKDLFGFMAQSLDVDDYVRVILAMLAVSLVGLLPAIANSLLFDRVIPSGEHSLIFPICALLVGVALGQMLFGILRTMVSTRISLKLKAQMEAAMMARLLSLEADFFRGKRAGDMAMRIMSITQIIDIIVLFVFGSGLTAVFSLVYIVQIFAFAPALLVPALLVIAVQAVVALANAVMQARVQREILKTSLEVSGITPTLLNGISKIKLSGSEKRAFAQWANIEAKHLAAQYDRPLWYKVANTLPMLVALAGTIVIYWFAGTSGVSLANFMAFNAAYGMTSSAIIGVANMAGQIAQLQSLVEALDPLLEAVPEPSATGKSIERVSGTIDIAGVTFRYAKGLPPVLDNLSMKIRPGEYVAIAGKSGSGKSTLLRLLMGFEKPERGAIYYDGNDLADLNVRSLRRVIGVCLQNGSLFSGDIFNNITISTPGATMDDAWAAAELAGVADDIRAMPMGMHTLITEGSGGVSGGQRQRILIARAVCSNPRILMFDEATSALDNVTQMHVSDSLAKLNCTRIVVAHRLSTIKLADRIVVLDKGRIIEEGTYEELVALDGEFADLVKRQRLEGE